MGEMTHGRTEITLEKRRHIKKCNWLYQRIWRGYCIQSTRVSLCGQKKQSQKNPCKLKNIINLYFEKKKKRKIQLMTWNLKKKNSLKKTSISIELCHLLVLRARANVRGECRTILMFKTVLNPKSFTKMNQRIMKIDTFFRYARSQKCS